jgi:cytidylate kinase
MNHPSSLERFLAAHASQREKEREKPKGRPFVTISREAGAGGHTVGKAVAELLNEQPRKVPWTVFDKELVDAVIKEHNLPKNLSKYLTEAGVNAIESFVGELVGLHPAMDMLIRKTQETILALARMGNMVIIGRGANFTTRRLPGGFHVRLVASHETRLQRMRTYYELSEKEASRQLERTDEDREEYVRDAFDKDIADVLAYDCVINTSHISYEDAARMIVAHLQAH